MRAEGDHPTARWPWLAYAGGPVVLRLLASTWVVLQGFHAVSDDDFARTVIAQQFAQAPSWDPSGTSWLPFPFWLNGVAMLVLGPHFWVARTLAMLLSLLSTLGVYVAARWLGLERPTAALSAAFAAVLPHAVWLGYATVPEGFAAACCLMAVASTHQPSTAVRVWGAVLLGAATLSRYEAWAVAAVVATLNGRDAWFARKPHWWLPALLACAGPGYWLLHGVFTHGDALFFVSRVADYRRMLGRAPAELSQTLLGYPSALVRGEPELVVAAALALWPGVLRQLPQQLTRPLLAAAALLLFLVWGDVRDGAPTHHPERPLLFAWLVLCVLAAVALRSAARAPKTLLFGLAALALGLSVLRPWFTRRDDFIDRREELALGQQLQSRAATGRVLIDSGDYGYFAVIAGMETPQRAVGLADKDPRQAPLAFSSALERLEHHVAEQNADWVVVKRSELPAVSALGPLELQTERYALLRPLATGSLGQ